jgi:hypothetical protein
MNNLGNYFGLVIMGAFTIKRANGPQVQVLFKDYVFLSLKHGLHVLNKTQYWMMVPTSKV